MEQSEMQKCIDNPYYFATTYLKIVDNDGKELPYTTSLSEKEFNDLSKKYKIWNVTK